MKNWIALMICLAMLAGLTACGGDDNSKEDARISAIGALSENAVDSWVANGPTGLYGILHQRISTGCPAEDFETAMENQPQPTAWRSTTDITFLNEEKSSATATVTIVAGGQDIDQLWGFELENNVRWRVVAVPGLSECGG